MTKFLQPDLAPEGGFLISSKQVVLPKLLALSYFLILIQPALIFWGVQSDPFFKVIFSVQPFCSTLFASVSCFISNFLNLAQVFSPRLDISLNFLFQHVFSVLLPFLFFNITILYIVTYATVYSNEFSSVMVCAWILLVASLTFPIAISFALSHDFSDALQVECCFHYGVLLGYQMLLHGLVYLV